jgi:GNAT superfamily N-acetyltransferase
MELSTLTASEIDRVKPLWLAYHARHLEGASGGAPFLDAKTSWLRRRQICERALAEGGAVVVVHQSGVDHGYATWCPGRMPWPATFDVAPRLADFTSLVVLPDHAEIMEPLAARVEALAAVSGFPDGMVTALAADQKTIAFYRDRGFVPVWTILARFNVDAPETAGDSEIAVSYVPAHEVDDLRVFCDALHDHHGLVAGHLAPFISHDLSWDVFRPYFLAAAENGLALRAGPRDAPLGMVAATLLKDAPLFTDMWVLSGDVAEIEVLAIAEAARGQGLGTRLMRAIDARLSERGVRNQIVGAFEPNHSAVRFYLNLGFAPAVLQLAKFAR